MNVKVFYLQREKEEWRVKFARAISRGISNIEKLEKVEVEKAVKADILRELNDSFVVTSYTTVYEPIGIEGLYYTSF